MRTYWKILTLNEQMNAQHRDTSLSSEQQDKINRLDTRLEQTHTKKITHLIQAQQNASTTQQNPPPEDASPTTLHADTSQDQQSTPHRETRQIQAQQSHSQSNNFLGPRQNHPTTQRLRVPRAPQTAPTRPILPQAHHPQSAP